MAKGTFGGIILACGEAITKNQHEFDITSLWKHCQNEADMLIVIPKAKAVLERKYPGIAVQMHFTPDMSIKACISGDLNSQIPQAEIYLREMIEKKNKQISFHQLRKYYKNESQLYVEQEGFFGYIRFLFNRIAQMIKKTFSYKICKDKQKIVVCYS